jgi:hypothetical protein
MRNMDMNIPTLTENALEFTDINSTTHFVTGSPEGTPTLA